MTRVLEHGPACRRTLCVLACCLVFAGGATRAEPVPRELTRPASLRARIETTLRGAFARVRQLAARRSRARASFVPAYVFENIIKNTPIEGPGLTASQRAENQRMVAAARANLAAMQAMPSERPGLLARVRALVGRTCRRGEDTPLNYEICDANFTTQRPGTLELSPSKTETPVEAARRAHTAMVVFTALNRQLGFDVTQILPSDGKLVATVRYTHADNASYYDVAGGSRMVLGGGQIFDEFSLSPDIIYHELGHGLTEHVLTPGKDARQPSRLAPSLFQRLVRELRDRLPGRGLNYRSQAGALNESISDIYGAIGEQYAAGLTLSALREENWVIGSEIMSRVQAQPGHPLGMRNLLHPGTAYDDPHLGKDPQPDHMKDLYTGPEDNFGVHINSGIPNRAFAVASTKLAERMPTATTWQTTGYVWMHAMSLLGRSATFQDAANATYKMAKQLFPDEPAIAEALQEGWSTVGVPPKATAALSFWRP